jgi:hypothetical protein
MAIHRFLPSSQQFRAIFSAIAGSADGFLPTSVVGKMNQDDNAVVMEDVVRECLQGTPCN